MIGKNFCICGIYDCLENVRCFVKFDEIYDCECLVGYKDYVVEKGRDCRSKDFE